MSVRRVCAALPDAFEKIHTARPASSSRGKGWLRDVFQHHPDEMTGCRSWVAVQDDLQPLDDEESPNIYFYPRYVGAGGTVGVLLDQIADDALDHLRERGGSSRRRSRARAARM